MNTLSGARFFYRRIFSEDILRHVAKWRHVIAMSGITRNCTAMMRRTT
jgi:hypothetical protein